MLLLVPSPLLGPATWRPVETWLRQEGRAVSTVDLGGGERTVDRVIDAVLAAAGDRSVILVPHSNAGLYAPYLRTRLDVRATVYVDAALPDPAAEGRTTALAPAAFLDFLRTLADDHAMLPPWTEWWDDVEGLFPDEAAQRAVEHEQPRLPLAYFEQRVPVPAGWADLAASYLAFGETYAQERDQAEHAGWPTSTLAGGHLHQLHDPVAVGQAIVDLIGARLPRTVSGTS